LRTDRRRIPIVAGAVVAALVGATVAGSSVAWAEPEAWLAPPGSVAATTVVETPAAPPPLRRFQVAVGGSFRFTSLDPHDATSEAQLVDYGWAAAGSPVVPTLAAEVAFVQAPILDLGVTVARGGGDHAAGLGWTDDRVHVSTTQIALLTRMHWAKGRPFIPEPRVDIGVARRTITLHGVADADSVPYVRAGMDWRLGNRTGGVQVSVGYLVSGRASGGKLDPAIGGLDVGVGPYLRF
jgi:hypothetical protein